MNAKLVTELNFLREMAEIMGDPYREKAYRAAIEKVLAAGRILGPNDQVGVGRDMQKKISEFLTTGKIAELETLRRSPAIVAHRELGQVLGVGPTAIRKWLEMGISTRTQLAAAVNSGRVKLTHMQTIGLKYYKDLITKVPRAEVSAIGLYLKNTILRLSPTAVFEIVGSYRRGAAESGDIDVIVSSEKHFDPELLLSLQKILPADPHYVETIVAGRERFSFLFKWASVIRQVDILNICWASYPTALMYFTGSYQHNEWLRGQAKAQGYKLNQAGLFRNGAQIAVANEREVYAHIGVAYVPPEKR